MMVSITCFHAKACAQARQAVIARCEAPQKKNLPDINEDVLAKLRAFEEENAKLKEQLASKEDTLPATPEPTYKVRVDGTGMKRETLFGQSSSAGSWLSESDVDFFTGGGLSEQDSGTSRSEEEAVVKRRLLIGGGLSVAAIALALIPTEALDGAASKPLYVYLVPVLRSIALLEDLAVEVEKGNLDSTGLVVSRILGRPNDVRKNLYSAIEAVDSSRRQQAREAVGSFVDYVQQIDYNKYFDSVGTPDGRQMAQYQDFSLKSAQAAAQEGKRILKFFPPEAVQDARDTLAQY